MVLVSPRNRLDLMPEGLPELTLGYEALAWAAKYLKHPNGKRAGKKWMFTREQARFVLWMYAVDENGDWLFYHFSRRLAKGSGKSPFAATMALVELLAPVRFKQFDSTVPGGCVGKPVDMPWVQIAAVSENQTANTMRMVRAMAGKKAAPLLHRDYDLDVGKTQINVGETGKLEVITSSATSAEGAEVSFVVADELEHWLKSNGGHELHSTLVDNLTKSGSRMLETLNAWKPGLDSVAEDQFEAWVDQEEGRARNERKILYDARIAPHGTDLADEDSLRSALEFVYADCPWADIDATVTRIWHTKTKPDDAWRKYLNRPTVAETAWIDPADWALMERRDIVVEDGEEIVMFFDGSLSNDHTALVGCRMSDGHVFTLGVWEPAEEGTVDVDAVDAGVARAFDTYTVAVFFADVREWESFVKVDWPQRYKDHIAVWATPNGKPPEPIAWDMRGKDFKFTQACELVEMQIGRHEFTHDGNDRLTEHVHNARRYPGRWGDSVRKESRKSKKKIDAAVCMIGARMVWQLVKDDPARNKPERSNEAFFL